MQTSHFAISTQRLPRIAVGLALVWATAGCGYKGPLYLPPPPPPAASLTKPPVITLPSADQSKTPAPAQATPIK
ncbi:MAG: hypothetical protein EPN46_12695 [Candidimonas sp.]|nr:MAG: hypothetical protein EPN77_01640 [Candidimonas sp.]TAM18659.1 MAG: hypothetical protein EPN62_19485 [Candidimonas sp.]TAM74258.1 MAG: hypothetical protein EPN46_12695 [Candidimonas sp.]